MSLQLKFAVLLALLGVTVVGSLSAALWSFSVLDDEVSRPFADISSVMRGLGNLKVRVEEINSAVAGRRRLTQASEGEARRPPGSEAAAGTDPDAVERVRASTDAMVADLARLESNAWYIPTVGRSTPRNLRARIESTAAAAGQWAGGGVDTAAMLSATADLHDLIELTEAQVLRGAEQWIHHDDRVRNHLLVVLGLASAWAILAGALGFTLMRRWVVYPVAGLRTATARIGAGDFGHRIPVAGRDELAQLSAEVNHMAELIRGMQDERIERERLAAVGEMVRRLAHNLRNPLAGIRGLAEVTRADLPPGDLHEAQDRIIAAVDRFERWLKELLGATSPLTVSPEPSDVEPMLRGVIESHRPVALTKNVDLILEMAGAPPRAVFDPRHLEQAIVALVANAIDASPPGARVVVSARPGPSDDEWQVWVTDQGPGVPRELVDKIFKPYFTTKRDGNGIGLAVAQQVVRAHGGRIRVEAGEFPSKTAQVGQGATFVVQLPRTQDRGSEPEMARNGHRGVKSGQDPGGRG